MVLHFSKQIYRREANTVGPQSGTELSYLVALRLSKNHSLRLLLLPVTRANIKSRKRSWGNLFRVLLSCKRQNRLTVMESAEVRLAFLLLSYVMAFTSTITSSLSSTALYLLYPRLILPFCSFPFTFIRYFHSVFLYFHAYLD